MVPTSSQDEALARDGVSREVPCSALKGETVPDSLPASQGASRAAPGKSGLHARGEGERVLALESLIDRLPDELWNEVRDIVQETGIKIIPMEKTLEAAQGAPRDPRRDSRGERSP